MRRVEGIAGACWAADILLGNKPLPQMQQAGSDTKKDSFKKVLDKEIEKLKAKGAKE